MTALMPTPHEHAPSGGTGMRPGSTVQATPANLYQRLALVAHTVGAVTATGANQFKARAVSIEDVENTIRPALAEHGIITRWTYVELVQVEKALWRAHLRVTVINADDPEDRFEDEWVDIGGNPMAATSFARKGYYKSLLHLAEAGDDARENAAAPTKDPIAPARSLRPSLINQRCAQCRADNRRTRNGADPSFVRLPDGDIVCNGVDDKGTPCRHVPEIPF